MNERIDGIAFEAGCHRHKYWDPNHPDLEGFIISQAVLDKFAELIVTECVTLIRDMGNPTYINHSDWQVSRNDAMRVIREHFGVEE